ncbi:MAG: hypothetical protein ACLFUZ_04965 [Candidatus Micrarchaeia archaeon]
MNPTRQGPIRTCAGQQKTGTRRITRIGAGPQGKLFSFRQLPPEREMNVPAYRFSSLVRSDSGNLSKCIFSFYITGRALVLDSLSWELRRGNQKRKFVDEGSCKTIIKILDKFAARHRATTIYASRREIPLPLLLNLGFRPARMRDFLERKVENPNTKS